MALAVTYSGIESAEGGGNIFKDVRFWVAMRVPTRPFILDLIKKNGGLVVPLEKSADMLIADYLRRDAPAGSYSWKFVTDSVDNGIIQLKDRYRIGPDPNVPRQAGTGGPQKSSRTRFTTEDDAVLAKYVLSQPIDRTGNRIYMEFEKTNPRHTWQSWRNRWSKKLMLLSDEQVERLAGLAVDNPPEPVEEDSPKPVAPKVRSRTVPKNAEKLQEANDSNGQHLPERVPNQPAARDMGQAEEKAKKQVGKKVAKQVIATTAAVAAVAAAADTVFDGNNSPEPESDRLSSKGDDSETNITSESMKNQFYKDLDDFMLANDLSFEKAQRIGNDHIELWDLGKVVGAQNVPPEEVDWIKVADDLGYSWEVGKKVSAALQECYENYLMEFLEAMISFGAGSGDEEEAVEDPDAETEVEFSEPPLETRSPPDHIPSSPPSRILSRKRKPDPLQPSSPAHVQKRRRGNTRTEIPSTPDRDTHAPRRRGAGTGPSPSLGQSVDRPGHARDAHASQKLPILRNEQNEENSRATRQNTGASSGARPRGTLQTQQSTFEVTPSQQLHSEQSDWLNSTPIPLHLDKGRTKRDSTRERPSEPMHATGHRSSGSRPASRPVAVTPAQPRLVKGVRRSLPGSWGSSDARTPLRKLETPSTQRRKTAPVDHHRKEEERKEDERQQEIKESMEHFESLGYSRKIVVDGMRRTNMAPGLAGVVMQSLKDGNGVPSHHEGIWTDRDGASLRLVDSIDRTQKPATAEEVKHRKHAKREWDRLVQKHYLEGVDLRRRFLDAEAKAEEAAKAARQEADAAKE